MIKIYTEQDYKVEVVGNKLTVTGAKGTKVQEISAYSTIAPLSRPWADAVKRAGLDPAKYISVGGAEPIRAGAAAFIQSHIDRIKVEAAVISAKFNQDFPGYCEIKAERNKQEAVCEAFTRAMLRGDGRLPAAYSGPLKDLEATFPKAVAYLQAESFSYSSNNQKAASGTKAMDRMRAGEPCDLVLDEMKREWSQAAEAAELSR